MATLYTCILHAYLPIYVGTITCILTISFRALMDLRRNDLYGCGTLRSNRKGFPATLKPMIKKGFQTRGDCKTCQNED